MPGYFYYAILAVIGTAGAVIVIRNNKEHAKLLTFFFFSMIAADCGEVLVLIFLNGYSYKPGLFGNSFREQIYGHILPNSTLWPATAILVASYALRIKWILVITFVYMLLDILFVRVGIYEHHWWKLWMTGAAIFTYCILMRFWYQKLEDRRFVFLRWITFDFTLFALTFVPFIPLLLTERQFYIIGIYEDIFKDSVVFAFLYHLVTAGICVLIICNVNKWYLKLAPVLVYIVCDSVFAALGVLQFKGGWNIYGLILVHILSMSLFVILEKHYRYKAVLQ